MSQVLPNLDETLGYQLKKTSDVLRRQMDSVLAACQLTTPQYACLLLLSHQPQHSAALARQMFLSRQTTTLVLQSLKTRGLVYEAGQPGQRREQTLQITPEGLILLQRAVSFIAPLEHLLETGLSASEKEKVLQALTTWQQRLDSFSPAQKA